MRPIRYLFLLLALLLLLLPTTLPFSPATFLSSLNPKLLPEVEVRMEEERRTAVEKRQQKHRTASHVTNNLQLVASLLASHIIPTSFTISFAHCRTPSLIASPSPCCPLGPTWSILLEGWWKGRWLRELCLRQRCPVSMGKLSPLMPLLPSSTASPPNPRFQNSLNPKLKTGWRAFGGRTGGGRVAVILQWDSQRSSLLSCPLPIQQSLGAATNETSIWWLPKGLRRCC